MVRLEDGKGLELPFQSLAAEVKALKRPQEYVAWSRY